MGPKPKPVEERFWTKVAKGPSDQCWLWQASQTRTGYAKFFFGSKKCVLVEGHRVAYMLTVGDIPEGQLVRHRCDVPLCCNPNHLELGTHADNMQDAVKRKRVSCGIHRKHLSVLNEEKVREIRTLHRLGWTHGRLGDRFGVNRATITYLVQGKTWKHVS